jgi:hypothetical protein
MKKAIIDITGLGLLPVAVSILIIVVVVLVIVDAVSTPPSCSSGVVRPGSQHRAS